MALNHAQRTRIAVTAVVLLAVFMGLRRLREEKAIEPAPVADSQAAQSGEVRRSTRIRPNWDIQVAPERNEQTRVSTRTTTSPAERGIRPRVLDDFSKWTDVPQGYAAKNIIVTDGGITLDNRDRRSSRSLGTLESPILDITTSRTEVAPRKNNLPDGSEVVLEMSFEEAGGKWSEWSVIERRIGGFEKRQALMSASDDVLTTAPPGRLRYRLSLEANGDELPVLGDLKIWRTHLE